MSAAVLAAAEAVAAIFAWSAALVRTAPRSLVAWVKTDAAGRPEAFEGWVPQYFCQVRIWSASQAWPSDSIMASVALRASVAAVTSALTISLRGVL